MGNPASTSDWQAAEVILDQLLDLEADQRRQAAERLTQPGSVRACVLAMLAALERPGLLDQAEISIGAEHLPVTLPDLSGQVVDRYRLEALIGRGGMSAVYRARRIDGAFDEAVAIKLLNPALLSTRWGEQFQREVRFLAGLRHPNIASLLDAGVMPDGTPWMATEFIEGQSIDRYCDTGVSLRQRVALVRDLCRAVGFAQANLIVHRDIKPDNVLVTAQGRVVLLDFGIARALDAGAEPEHMTRLTRVFTPQYAAPEQLAGEPITTATDVFAIGALLFRLLTGRAPFAATFDRRAHGHTGPPSREIGGNDRLSAGEQRQLSQAMRGDLDNVVQKAMAPEPSERYANAAQLGEDLDAWLAFRSVRARRPSVLGRLRLFCRRRTALASSLAALVVVTLVGLYATLWQAGEARAQAHAALAASDRAVAVSEFLISLFEGSDPDLHGNRPPDAKALLDAGLERVSSEFAHHPETRVELMLALAHIYRKLGEIDQADSLLSLSQAEQAGDALQRARAWMIRSFLHYDRGEPEPAITAARQAQSLLASDAPLALRLELGLTEARSLSRAGKRDEAVELAQAQLSLLESSANSEPTLRLAILAELIGFLTVAGRPTEALAPGEEASQLIAAGIGIPTTVLTALANHSHALQDLGRLSESVALQRQALAVVEQAYPAGHRRRAGLAGNLATRLQTLGQMVEAEQYFEQALASYAALYDQPNMHSAATHNNYGLFLLLMERPADARPHLETAAAVAADVFGANDPRALSARQNLAYADSLLDQPQSESALREVLAARQAVHGTNSPQAGIVLGLLADHLRRNGQPEAALVYSKRAVAIMTEAPEALALPAIMTHVHHARNLADLREHEVARASFEASLSIIQAAGANAGNSALRAIDAYSEWLAEHDPAYARSLLETWLATEQAQLAQQWPLVKRLHQRLALL